MAPHEHWAPLSCGCRGLLQGPLGRSMASGSGWGLSFLLGKGEKLERAVQCVSRLWAGATSSLKGLLQALF